MEDQEECEGCVVGTHSHACGELSLIQHIHPSAEEEEPWHTIKRGLCQEASQVSGQEGSTLWPVPKIVESIKETVTIGVKLDLKIQSP